MFLAAAATSASACDLCSVYSALDAHGESSKGWQASLAEQFTRFGTLQQDGDKVDNIAGQYLNSSITQVVLGYNFVDSFGVQANVPFIHRWYQRPDDNGNPEVGHETGFGDVSFLGHVRVVNIQDKKTALVVHLLGGVKVPTGSTHRLHGEVDEFVNDVILMNPPPPIDSGTHGHDLTLGSGSVDGVIGATIFTRYQRAFFSGNIQYAIRTKGDFDYTYANDLTWNGGPGVYLALEDSFTVSLQCKISGETKGRDTFMGMKADDTGITSVFVGPEINFTWKDKFSAEIGIDLPVSLVNTAFQAVPDYRVRAGLTFRF